MNNRKAFMVCGIVGAIAGIAAGIGKIVIKKQKDEKKPWDKPGRVWEA